MLPVPILDDRRFQDIVDEAKKRIPQYCEEWTDHNVSDPGVTMIELFAWMTDMILYRMNQVPHLHYVKMLDLLGVQLRPPQPAQVSVTFWLSAPQATPVMIPAGTEVATTQTETERSIVFTTDRDFYVVPPKLGAVLSEVATDRAHEKRFVDHNLRRLQAGGEEVDIFSTVPQVNDALYFGFEEDLGNQTLGLTIECRAAGGAGIDPTLPPTLWEVAQGRQRDSWVTAEVEFDSTQGFNGFGRIQLHLPRMNKRRIHGKNLYWVRVRIKQISPAEQREGMRPYRISPRISQVESNSWGGTTSATHTQAINFELLGRSDGTPGQRFLLRHTPVLERQAGETVCVELRGQEPEQWQEVVDFSESKATDRHYTIDSINGEVRFAPALRQRDGSVKRHGAIPSRTATIIFQRYRTGGGVVGNVDVGMINTLKTGIPFIDRVSNREAAHGGLDAESVENAMMRAPALFRTRDRALTSEDFEFLAQQALPAKVRRVRALQARPTQESRVPPGQVYVLIVPQVRYPAGYLSPDELSLLPEDLATIENYLDERRLLTTRLNVRTPAYRWVASRVSLGVLPGADEGNVERTVLARLYQFLNPLTGGVDGQGWQFGRTLFVADVYQALQNLPEVAFVRSVQLYTARPGGERVGNPVETVELVTHGVIASGIHEVVIVN